MFQIWIQEMQDLNSKQTKQSFYARSQIVRYESKLSLCPCVN